MIYGVTLGSDGWYVALQDVPRIGPLDWSDALEVAEGLNQELAASPNDAQARQKTGPCEPGPGLEAAEDNDNAQTAHQA